MYSFLMSSTRKVFLMEQITEGSGKVLLKIKFSIRKGMGN